MGDAPPRPPPGVDLNRGANPPSRTSFDLSPNQANSNMASSDSLVGGPTPSFMMPSTLSRPMRPPRRPPEPFQKPKVAIPRLRPESDAGSAASSIRSDKHRVSHACESCRVRKVRCSGGRPVCDHCKEHEMVCVYGDGKRDRAKKELGSLHDKVDEYESFLRHLSLNSDATTQQAIHTVLSKAAQYDVSAVSSPVGGKRRRDGHESGSPDVTPDNGGENLVSAEVGSVGSLDKVHEDINFNGPTGAAGFFGKNSDVAWVAHLKDQLIRHPSSSQADLPGQETFDHKPIASLPSRTGSSDVAMTGKSRSSLGLGDDGEHGSPQWTYNLDDFELEVPHQLNKLDLPPRDIADQMANAYFETVHPSFPLLLKRSFYETYEQSYQPYGQPITDQNRATINLVLALGAKYLVCRNAGICDDRDHLALFCRARSLSLENGAMWHAADLHQTQVAGLATLYLIAAGHINRAWFMSGLAIRYAQGLGLHLRTDSKHLTDVEVELRVRAWWTIYSLERLLGVMTGRPSSIHEQDVSTLLPCTTEEGIFPQDGKKLYTKPSTASTIRRLRAQRKTQSPNSAGSASSTSQSQSKSPRFQSKSPSSKLSLHSSLSSPSPSKANKPSDPSPIDYLEPNSATYFIFRTRMNIMIHHIVNDLYSAATVQNTWAEVQQFIAENEAEIEQWLTELPPAFNFTTHEPQESFARERTELGLLYWSSRLLLNRPCLCRFENKIPDESQRSKDFNRDAAGVCVGSARSLLSLLPDDHDPLTFYHLCPWWAMLHYLMQSVVILVIELKMETTHIPDGRRSILVDIRKVLRWLRSMATVDPAAKRGCKSLEKLLRSVEPRGGRLVSKTTEDARSKPAFPASGATAKSGAVAPLDNDLNQDDFFENFTFGDLDYDLYNPFMYSLFDQDSTLNPQNTSSMFPTEAEMDLMNRDEPEGPPHHPPN
ncbi:MAG: hypothetical protein M4579_005851 [Chaenotheca gracillima]|nr:MAG: hypothetical protein M4579_005851 [Chaenotheca gracillima]